MPRALRLNLESRVHLLFSKARTEKKIGDIWREPSLLPLAFGSIWYQDKLLLATRFSVKSANKWWNLGCLAAAYTGLA